jgi:hypothetical protein
MQTVLLFIKQGDYKCRAILPKLPGISTHPTEPYFTKYPIYNNGPELGYGRGRIGRIFDKTLMQVARLSHEKNGDRRLT